ncbi:MAG: putative tail component of prophage, partial [Caulobacter sp.]|nr:putative tail component of prophage [Caulobacter sp.]
MSDVSLADLRTQSAAAEPAVKALTLAVTGLGGGLSTMARGARDATGALAAYGAAQQSLLQTAGALSKAQLDAGVAARRQADNVVYLDTAHRQAAASATGAATAVKTVGGEAKVSASEIAKLASTTVDLVSGLASGTQPLATTLKQVIELAGGLGDAFAKLEIGDAFQKAKSQGLGFSEVMKGVGVQLGLLQVIAPAAAAEVGALAAANTAGTATAVTATTAVAAEAAANTAVATSAMAAAGAEAVLAEGEIAAAGAAGVATTAASTLAAANVAVAETATAAAVAESVALTPLAAAFAAIAAVAAAAAAGFGLFHHELSKGYPKDITEGMNLTEEQLARVKDKAVTFGDTFMATLTVVGRHIMAGP